MFRIEQRGDTYFCIGAMTEAMDLTKSLPASGPLKLNLSAVTTINSIGVRVFRDFAAGWGNLSVELFECSTMFLDAVNTFPGLLGTPPVPSRVRSVFLPFRCPACQKRTEAVVDTKKMTIETAAAITGPKCCLVMEIDGEPEDFFVYLECEH